MPFVQITAGQTDADSPLDQALMDTVRLNFDDHESRLLTFTPADGTVTAIKIVDYNVTLGKLKLGYGSFSLTAGNYGSVSIEFAVHYCAHLLDMSLQHSGGVGVKSGSINYINGVSNSNLDPAYIYNGKKLILSAAHAESDGWTTATAYWDYHTN